MGDATDRGRTGRAARGGGEFEAIERITRRFEGARADECWIGDDAAVVRLGGGVVAVTTDAVVAGVHADLTLTSITDLGWKALAVNVSDLAAMGLVASRAVVTVSGPPDTDLDGLYDGLEAAAGAFGCPIVGGDLTEAPTLVVSVTALGNAAVVPPPVLRSGARGGDAVWVTGPLGGSAAGLRALREGRSDADLIRAHARPRPRVAEGVAAREVGATAMIDVSDGFAADLSHVLDASRVGCVLDRLPVAVGATREDAVSGGEDYELVWCIHAETDVVAAFAARGLAAPVRLGLCVADESTRVLDGEMLPSRGWRHQIGGPS